MDAREAPGDEHLRLALMRGLIRRSRWLVGTGLSILGWPLQLLALMLAPLVVVQPALAAGLLVLMLLAERMLGEHAGRKEHLAMWAIVLGVVGAGLFAPARSTTHTAEQLTITVVLVGLGVASLLPYALKVVGRRSAQITIVGAGLAYAWSGVATKLASDDLSNGHLLPAAAWALSTAGASAIGVLSEMSALQSRPAIQVAPVVFVTQTLVPIMLAPLLLGESFANTPLAGVPLSASLALLVVGATYLARSPLLLAIVSGESASNASGSTPRPPEPSHPMIFSRPSTEPDEPSSSTTKTSPARIGR